MIAKRPSINWGIGTWSSTDGVVPVAMEATGPQIDCSELFVGDVDGGVVGACIERRFDRQAGGRGGGVGNQADDCLHAE